MESELGVRKVVTKTVSISEEEAKVIWSVCKDMGYYQWSPCLRHILKKCVEKKCWE